MLRESVLRLAALLDYKPAPGVAATTYLAFTLEKGKQVKVPIGLRVQSVPGQDEKPQKFETVEAITADGRLNQVPVFPEPEEENPLHQGSTGGTLRSDSAELAPGDKLVIFTEGTRTYLEGQPAEEKRIEAVEWNDTQTVISWSPPMVVSREPETRVQRFRRKFRLFGTNALTSFLRPSLPSDTVESQEIVWHKVETSFHTYKYGGGPDIVRRTAPLVGENVLDLDGPYEDLAAGTELLIVIKPYFRCVEDEEGELVRGATSDTFVACLHVRNVEQINASWGSMTSPATRVTLEDVVLPGDDFDIRNVTIYELIGSEIKLRNWHYPGTISGNTIYVPWNPLDMIKPGRTLILDDKRNQPQAVTIMAASPVDIGGEGREVDAEVVGVVLEASRERLTGYKAVQHEGQDTFTIRVVLHVPNPQFLEQLSEIAILTGPQQRALVRKLDSSEGVFGPDLAVAWEVSEDGCTYTFSLRRGVHMPDHIAITFTPALTRSLDTETAVLYGNVVKATHGETVAGEVLGSGDASTEFQSFAIKKSPATFVPKPGVPHGAANTLEVRIGGVLWHELKDLYRRKSDERIYTTTVDDEGTMTVQFGNGITGARLPTGRHNVVATYRQGLGRDGNVKANSLTTLLDRPVGLKNVTNPGAAQGGADPESLEKARANAPNTVRTFGRIVSLRDFEDAAREFAGVAKARATWVWDGEEQVVCLTVAGDAGARITGTTYENLVADLNSRRDPNRKLLVNTYRKVPIQAEAVIQVHSDYVAEDVRTSAEKALQNYFAFDSLDLGQPIHLSDVYRVLQDVKGVVAVDINRLQFKNTSDRMSHGATEEPVQGHLRIYPARLTSTDPVNIAPAELAVIESSNTDISITVSTG